MQGMLTAFQEGGAAMILILAADGALAMCFVVVAVIVAASRVSPPAARVARFLAVATLAGAFLPILVGAAGYWLGMRNVYAAVERVDPEFTQQVLEVGQAEAANNLWFGGLSGVICLLVSGGLAAVAFTGERADSDG